MRLLSGLGKCHHERRHHERRVRERKENKERGTTITVVMVDRVGGLLGSEGEGRYRKEKENKRNSVLV